MTLYGDTGNRSLMLEESRKLKLFRMAVWAKGDDFVSALKEAIKD
jgi:hypothetical protein